MSISIRPIQDLKSYWDPVSTYDEAEVRIKSIEDMFSIKKGEEGYPTHKIVASHTSFIMKNKEKIVEYLGEKKYADTFCKLVSFLEQNPEKVEKKPKSTVYDYLFSIPVFGYSMGCTSLTGGDTIYSRYASGYTLDYPSACVVTLENPDTVEIQQPQEATLSRDGLDNALAELRRVFGLNNNWYGSQVSLGFDSITTTEENNEGEENGGR